MPGTDPLAAMRLILDELPDLPYLVELPDRGAGADIIGRTAALLVNLPVDVTTRGWRLADRPGRDLRRAQRCWPGTSTRWKRRRTATGAR